MSRHSERSEESLYSARSGEDARVLATWRKNTFRIGIALLTIAVTFYVAWLRFNRSPLCSTHTLGNECGFLIALASIALIIFGRGMPRVVAILIALITIYCYIGSIGIAVMDC
jgi:hypothetical protein